MHAERQDLLHRWLPVLVCVVGLGANVAWMGNWAGKVEARVAHVERLAHDPTPQIALAQALETFTTRAEFQTRNQMRDAEMADLRGAIAALVVKIDKLVDYQLNLNRPAAKP
jgi:hypothetical protein